MDTNLITKKEACDLLRVSASTLDRYVLAGMLTKVKLGDSRQAPVRYRRSDVERLVGSSLKPGPTNTDAARNATVNADRAAAPPERASGYLETYRPRTW